MLLTPVAFLVHDAAEQHPEVPLVEPEAKEHQRAVGEGPPNPGWDEILVPGDTDEEVEVVVLGEHQRARACQVPEQVVDQRSLVVRPVRPVAVEHRGRPAGLAGREPALAVLTYGERPVRGVERGRIVPPVVVLEPLPAARLDLGVLAFGSQRLGQQVPRLCGHVQRDRHLGQHGVGVQRPSGYRIRHTSDISLFSGRLSILRSR